MNNLTIESDQAKSERLSVGEGLTSPLPAINRRGSIMKPRAFVADDNVNMVKRLNSEHNVNNMPLSDWLKYRRQEENIINKVEEMGSLVGKDAPDLVDLAAKLKQKHEEEAERKKLSYGKLLWKRLRMNDKLRAHLKAFKLNQSKLQQLKAVNAQKIEQGDERLRKVQFVQDQSQSEVQFVPDQSQTELPTATDSEEKEPIQQLSAENFNLLKKEDEVNQTKSVRNPEKNAQKTRNERYEKSKQGDGIRKREKINSTTKKKSEVNREQKRQETNKVRKTENGKVKSASEPSLPKGTQVKSAKKVNKSKNKELRKDDDDVKSKNKELKEDDDDDDVVVSAMKLSVLPAAATYSPRNPSAIPSTENGNSGADGPRNLSSDEPRNVSSTKRQKSFELHKNRNEMVTKKSAESKAVKKEVKNKPKRNVTKEKTNDKVKQSSKKNYPKQISKSDEFLLSRNESKSDEFLLSRNDHRNKQKYPQPSTTRQLGKLKRTPPLRRYGLVRSEVNLEEPPPPVLLPTALSPVEMDWPPNLLNNADGNGTEEFAFAHSWLRNRVWNFNWKPHMHEFGELPTFYEDAPRRSLSLPALSQSPTDVTDAKKRRGIQISPLH